MVPSRQRLPRHGFLRIVLAVYVAAAALLPIAHHDIACHFKSSTHCTSCIIGSAGDLASDASDVGNASLNRVGCSVVAPEERIDSLSLPAASGRAPPTRA